MQSTSIEAYNGIAHKIGNNQRIIIKLLLRAKRPVTNREIAEELDWPINTITPRVRELADMGIVYIACKKPCRLGGRTSIHWKLYINKQNTKG